MPPHRFCSCFQIQYYHLYPFVAGRHATVMKILLINPNQYHFPPVPPLALEYLVSALHTSSHTGSIVDLCFEPDPCATLQHAVEEFRPDIAGITIRNIDSVLFHNNTFFMNGIRDLVVLLKKLGLPVIAGGIGYSVMPARMLTFLDADWGILGPGEKALPAFLDQLQKNQLIRGHVLNGWQYGIDADLVIERGTAIDYSQYIQGGGIAGFETQKGCLGRCPYCTEGGFPVLQRNPQRVIDELWSLTKKGLTEFHLCDSEFNQELAYCYSFLDALIETGPEIRWALYMKSEPSSEQLFKKLQKSGAYLLTLTVPSGKNDLAHLPDICAYAKKYDMKLAIDCLCGLPGETVESVRETIALFKKLRPDTVGVTSTVRLYPETAVAKAVMQSPDEQRYLTGTVEDNPDFLYPVFYARLPEEELREMIDGDPLFRIEGFEKSTNYERVKGSP